MKRKINMNEQFYLFQFNDDSSYEMTCGISCKDALWEMAKYTNTSSELLHKALKGFGENDVEDLVDLYNHFSWKRIENIYIVKEKIYGYM